MANRRVANNMDPVVDHHTPQERQSAVMSKLSDHQAHQSSKQSHAEDPSLKQNGLSLKNKHTSEQDAARQNRFLTSG